MFAKLFGNRRRIIADLRDENERLRIENHGLRQEAMEAYAAGDKIGRRLEACERSRAELMATNAGLIADNEALQKARNFNIGEVGRLYGELAELKRRIEAAYDALHGAEQCSDQSTPS